MICVAFVGGGGVLSEVSVLCGAGGGLTVHAVSSSRAAVNEPTTRAGRREVVGTPFRLSACAQTLVAPQLRALARALARTRRLATNSTLRTRTISGVTSTHSS